MSHSRTAPEGARSILEAASTLFAREGYGPVSISQIAEQAGVCKANVFHHYATKETLFMAVMQAASSQHAAWAEALLDEPGSCADKLRKLIRYEMATMCENEQRTRLILREVVDHGTCHGRELAQNVFHRNFSAVIALFEQGKARGEFHKNFDPAVAAVTFRGALSLYFQCGESLRQFKEARHLRSPDSFADRVCEVLLAGVVGPTPAAASSKSIPAPRRNFTGKKVRA